ncbi:hypothetical protein [Pseudomaricurvus albidus]|nr:hypothetical protein [Aestuariicella albida]
MPELSCAAIAVLAVLIAVIRFFSVGGRRLILRKVDGVLFLP